MLAVMGGFAAAAWVFVPAGQHPEFVADLIFGGG